MPGTAWQWAMFCWISTVAVAAVGLSIGIGLRVARALERLVDLAEEVKGQ